MNSPSLTQTPTDAVDISVVVVAICSIPQLNRALEALAAQKTVSSFEVIVAVDPEIGDSGDLALKFPEYRFLSRAGCRTPIELTVLGLDSATGERIVLTEDSCVATPGWLSAIASVPGNGHGAVGGVVEAMPGISNTMWAFCYVDFFRYMRPVSEGAAPTLSVCNVAYRRVDLVSLRNAWLNGFNETEMHGLLQERYGPLLFRPDAEVRVRRDVTFGDAVYERYAFGRLFGSTRVAQSPARRRMWFALVSPALPFLLMARMTAKARADKNLMRRFIASLPALLTMVLAWSWGEWLGYVTGRRPRRITTAPERMR